MSAYDGLVLSGDLDGAVEVLNKLEEMGLTLFVKLEVAKLLTLSNRQEEGYRLALAAVEQSSLPQDQKENLLSIFDPSKSRLVLVRFGLNGTSARNPLSKTDEKTALVAGNPVTILDHSDNSYSSGYSLSMFVHSPRAERFGYVPSLSVIHEKFPSDDWSKSTYTAGFGKRINFKLGLQSVTPSLFLEMQETNSNKIRETAKLSFLANQYYTPEFSTYQRFDIARDYFESATHMDASRNQVELGATFQKEIDTKVAVRRVWSDAKEMSSGYDSDGFDLSVSKRLSKGNVGLTYSYDHTLYRGTHFFFGTRREQRVTSWGLQFSPSLQMLGRLQPFIRIYAKDSKSNQFSFTYSDDGVVFGAKF